MTLVRYQPWNLLNQAQKDLNQFLGSFGDAVADDESNVVTSRWSPSVDIKEEDNQFVLYADLPGIDPDDIDITMEQGVLTIKGERSEETEEEREGFRRVERTRGAFYRRFGLPDSANPDGIKAAGKNGVLEIVIPKQERVQPRKITVQG